MLKFFRRKKRDKQAAGLAMTDLYGAPLSVGDTVECLRYDLGLCRLIAVAEGGYAYESLETGEQVSYLRMVDAATSFQKVRKVSGAPAG